MAHQSRELRPVNGPSFRDGRGGRQYTLPRVFLRDIRSGTRSIFQRFDAAAQDMGIKGAYEEEERILIEQYYDRMKQAMLRAIIRLQNGEGLDDVEGLKRDLKKAVDTLYNISQAPDSALAIMNASRIEDLVVRHKFGRRPHAYAEGIAAFKAMLEKARSK